MSTSTVTTARGLGPATRRDGPPLVAPLLDLFGRVDAKSLLESERGHVMARVVMEQVGGERIGQESRSVPERTVLSVESSSG